MKKTQKLIKSLLGDDIFEVLEKSQILKPDTNSVVDLEDTKIGLQIVPRAVLSFLFNRLKHMSNKGVDKINIPFVDNAYMDINKHGPDNYSGEVIQDGKVVNRFRYRTIPGIGLVLLSSFELYDINLLQQEDKEEEKEDHSKLQEIIDERIRLRELIEMVVDKKISQNEAMRNIIREKIHSFLTEKRYSDEPETTTVTTEQELSEKSAEYKKQEMREELDSMGKNTTISCPDCDTDIYKSNSSKITCCICFGEFMGENIQVIKKSRGCQLKFPKEFGTYNINNLLKIIKKQ